MPVIASSDLSAGKSTYAAVFISPIPPASLPDGNFCIDEIILEEAAPLYRLNGGLAAEYRLPGTLLAIKKFPLLADFSVSTALESEIHGDPFTQDRDAGSGLISRSNASVSLLGVKIDGNLALSAAPEEFNWNAGHELSWAKGPFQASESFSASPADDTLDHRVNIGFSKLFRTSFNAGVYDDLGRQERKWNLLMGMDPPAPKKSGAKQSYIPAIGMDFTAAWTSKSSSFDNKNYGLLWVESWQPVAPDLGNGADSRETRSIVIINENTKPLGAILTLEGNTMYIKNFSSTRSSNRVGLELPLELKSLALNFRMERGFKKHLQFSGNDVLDEGRKFGEGINDSLPLWAVFPFYSLFTPDLNDSLNKSLRESPSANITEYTWFNDLFGISGSFPVFYDYRAFLVPANASVNIERLLEQKMDTRLDILSLRGSLGFSAINMFGAFGYKPLFNFYQSDEYSSVLETSIAIPVNEEISYRLQWSAGAGFRGFTGAELGFYNTATIGSSGWLESMQIDWTYPRQKSLIGSIYGWIARVLKTQSSWLGLSAMMDNPYEQLLKESLELSFDHSGDYLDWALILGHEAIIRTVGRFNFSVFAKLQCTHSEKTKNLSFIGTIGTTLNVMF